MNKDGDSVRVWFREWAEALAEAKLAPGARATHRHWILCYLKHCKEMHEVVCRLSGRAYLRQIRAEHPDQAEACQAGLTWFFTTASVPRSSSLPLALRSDVPPPAKADLGATGWERQLIEKIRTRNLLWRTEQTYRSWAWKFSAFLGDKPPEQATGEDVRRYLTCLATRERLSSASQQQALNALVFFLQDALGKELGTFGDFTRARRFPRIPVVLTREECERLFDQLTGPARLMGELMFGSGLRLLELLRLRVKDVDLVRCTVTVRGGKGDKDRMTMLPESLVEPLRSHKERLRALYQEDRAAGLAGVWLPEGLARKYPQAGESWEWQWLFPSRQLSVDPQTGIRRRHHVQDAAFQHAIREAARRAELDKRVTPHTLRHSFATFLVEHGTDIRTVQDLLGHADVSTTQIYLHVMKKPGVGVKSPLDAS